MSQNMITLADLIENVKLGGGSVITSITELEPAAGPHASVAPAKFVDDKKSVFAYETRYIVEEVQNPEESEDAEKVVKGKSQKVVLIDSKQSELNRAEAAIEQGRQYGDEAAVKIPRAVVTYKTENGPVEYTDMELSHRIFDGHFRAGYVDGKSITENDQYRALRNSTPADMSALLNTAPQRSSSAHGTPPARATRSACAVPSSVKSSVSSQTRNPALNTDKHAVAAPASTP